MSDTEDARPLPLPFPGDNSLPLSAFLCSPLDSSHHHLQARGDLDVYSYWKSGISRAIKFMSSQRKCPTECAPAC